ncbi:MAG TPA: tRNA (N(6)-L-threonylcarbamoyladenosine(37)-C(2))-methylthiotransferase MtaB [Clostridiales bacterium]|nr:tRNA (N(6)-L-threonylcarbamoyladenosine(37)-C(2))-methylthiotransferase MtaB [Clostridiales bacterium]
MLELLTAAGCKQVPWGERADIYLVNTCTVTNIADKKSRNMIRRAIGQNPDGVVCVCGCLAQKERQKLLDELGVSAVIGTEDRCGIVRIVRDCLAGKHVNAVRDIAAAREFEALGVKTSGELTRGYIKIQEGCGNFCSYCIIPYVRGPVRSRPAESILGEARALAEGGVREVVLTGIHISSYGQDGGESLLAMLGGLAQVKGVVRIRLGSMEPPVFTEGFARALSGIKKVCPHFHVSLQSGSAGVLLRMNRKYTPGEYKGFLRNIRKYYDAPAITTDVITGFPGETEEEFLETARFVQDAGFARLHVFPYSEREGTPAAKMGGRVPPDVRKARAKQLAEMGETLLNRYRDQFAGTKQLVLFEQERGGHSYGYTDRYVRVRAAGGYAGQMKKVLLAAAHGAIMEATIIEGE